MIPSKKRGFRKITINNKAFNWRFSGAFEIRPNQNKSNKLIVDFGYFEHWIYIKDKIKPDDYEPKIVTSSFIRKAIENAIQLGWGIENKNQINKLQYRDGIFKFTE